jgi:2-keto-3-deoxy-L-rhamnonate aldolase RhmA
LTPDFQLLLFSTHVPFVIAAVSAGVDGIVIDWERLGKHERQAGADTQIGGDTLEDLQRVRASTDALIVCRLNAFSPTTIVEVEAAAQADADEVLLPMVRSPDEVKAVLDYAAGRSRVGIMVETVAAVERVKALTSLPISRVLIGLNDLAIERNSGSIFAAVADGTVEKICRAVTAPVAFGALTIPSEGRPIPCRLLIAEMMRLHCGFGILRRSFHRDIQGRDVAVEIPRLRSSLEDARRRAPHAIERDHQHLLADIELLEAARA